MKRRLWPVVAVVFLVTAVMANAAGLFLLPNEEAARRGATHCYEVEHSDLTSDTDAAPQTNTVVVYAKQAVTFVGMELEKAFDIGSTSTSTLTVVVGDGTDSDLYLTSTQLASDDTEVWYKHGPPDSATVSVTYATNDVLGVASALSATYATNEVLGVASALTVTYATNSFLLGDGSTQDLARVTAVALTPSTTAVIRATAVALTPSTTTVIRATAVTAATTIGVLGSKVYTADDTIDLIFSPDSDEDLEDYTAGKVRFYFKIEDAR